MARQRPTRAPHVEIDRIIIREAQYQLEVNRYNFGWAWPIMGWAAQVEIDRIVIRDVQYQFEVNRCRNEEIIAGRPRVGYDAMHKVQYKFEVNRCRNEDIIVKGNFGCAWPMWAGRPGNWAMHMVQYQFEVNRCRNEENLVKGNFGRGAPGLVMGPYIFEIDRIVIREVQYQLEVNRRRNEDIIVKDNFGWVWPIMGGAPQVEIDRIVMRDVQYQFEVNRCRNEEIIEKAAVILGGRGLGGQGAPGLVMAPCIVEIDRIAIKEVQYQFEVNRCRNEEIIVKGNSGWAWPMWAGRPRVGNGAMHIKGNFGWAWPMWAWPMWTGRPMAVNRCRNEKNIEKAIFGGRGQCGRGALRLVMGPCTAEIDRIVIRAVKYQFEVNRCRNEEILVKGNF
ncbi:hypothetical protein DPMN_027554 [Dreissena polymorpha]|uniref:Uncharacterized protein n=1 Tax=Dreissena polymorpha TaxID=45954 RepID=A0A9D4LVF7_DREPO|nr:hypothetical protein DPMN_027554 [Dreissena polymorpha]